MPAVVIAIDGPAGAGKSTVARKVAERLGLTYVDSGATYRAAALRVLNSGARTDDEQSAVGALTDADIEFRASEAGSRVFLDGIDVSDKIRTPEVTLAAARVSQWPEVRKKLISLQRGLARRRGVVMEGRDIGTVVFPEAPLKVFLKAESNERARRRLAQDREQGRKATLEETAQEIGRRDRLDEERKISPLIAAADAHEIDSTHLTPDEVVERIVRLAALRGLV